jgi:hypothetical protein
MLQYRRRWHNAGWYTLTIRRSWRVYEFRVELPKAMRTYRWKCTDLPMHRMTRTLVLYI